MNGARTLLLVVAIVATSTLPASEARAAEAAAESESVAPTEPDETEPAEEGVYGDRGALEAYRPFAHLSLDGMVLEAPLSVRERIESVGSFPIDRDGTSYEHEPALNTQLRVGAHFDSGFAWAPVGLEVRLEHDVFTGLHAGGAEQPALGDGMPDEGEVDSELRQAWARFSAGRYLHLSGGYMLSHWGLGLLANDGAHGWEPGSAYFSDPRGGDQVLRAVALIGPFSSRAVALALGADRVQDDDVLLPGDRADQFVAALTYGFGKPSWGGVYVAHRRQTTAEDRELNVTAVDIAGAWGHAAAFGELRLAGEAAYIFGETDLGPSVDFPTHDVQQLGAAVRVSTDFGRAGVVGDFLYASGDHNFDDGKQTGFKTDNNFHMGLILYRYVIAAQTARTTVTASDPELTGEPTPNLERLPTRGQITNALAFFPRAWVAPVDGLELYGGALFAATPVEQADAFNSRIAGGFPRNALDGEPSRYLGTELDAGVRYRTLLWGSELTVGVEAGVLLPGGGLRDGDDETMEPVSGGRAIAGYRF